MNRHPRQRRLHSLLKGPLKVASVETSQMSSRVAPLTTDRQRCRPSVGQSATRYGLARDRDRCRRGRTLNRAVLAFLLLAYKHGPAIGGPAGPKTSCVVLSVLETRRTGRMTRRSPRHLERDRPLIRGQQRHIAVCSRIVSARPCRSTHTRRYWSMARPRARGRRAGRSATGRNLPCCHVALPRHRPCTCTACPSTVRPVSKASNPTQYTTIRPCAYQGNPAAGAAFTPLPPASAVFLRL